MTVLVMAPTTPYAPLSLEFLLLLLLVARVSVSLFVCLSFCVLRFSYALLTVHVAAIPRVCGHAPHVNMVLAQCKFWVGLHFAPHALRRQL